MSGKKNKKSGNKGGGIPGLKRGINPALQKVNPALATAKNTPLTINPRRESIAVDPQALMKLYLNKNYDELSRIFIETFVYLKNNTFPVINTELQYEINVFIENFLYFFTREDYILNDAQSRTFISLNTVISNVVAISDFRNTDTFINILMQQKNNFAKILALYSSRNKIQLDYKLLFNVNPFYASLWYFNYFWVNDYGSVCYDNIIRHLNNVDDRLMLATPDVNEAYFSCTYLGLHNDKKIKRKVNEIIKPVVSNIKIVNNPNKNKVAIISGKWYRNTAVYKSCFDFIKSMKDDYELTLINIGKPNENLETSIFKEVKHVNLAGNALHIDPIKENEFGFAYFPDIGMVLESIYLANMRIAPIQAAGYGHPASTYGAEIDYWIGGADVEIHEMAEDNYSERLVLIPGLGQHPVYPRYEIQGIKKTRDDIIINCPWGVKKISYPLLTYLKEIVERSNRKVLFRFLVSGGGIYRYNNFVPYKREVESILGKDNVEMYPEKPYQEYMTYLEEGDITLDSWPYGGYNSMVDSIYLRKPFVSFESDRFFSRAASQLLRQMGLQELISIHKEDYIDKALKLIHDDAYRNDLCERFKSIDLQSQLFFSGLDKNFKNAVDYLIENHETLKQEGSRKPIIIK